MRGGAGIAGVFDDTPRLVGHGKPRRGSEANGPRLPTAPAACRRDREPVTGHWVPGRGTNRSSESTTSHSTALLSAPVRTISDDNRSISRNAAATARCPPGGVACRALAGPHGCTTRYGPRDLKSVSTYRALRINLSEDHNTRTRAQQSHGAAFTRLSSKTGRQGGRSRAPPLIEGVGQTHPGVHDCLP